LSHIPVRSEPSVQSISQSAELIAEGEPYLRRATWRAVARNRWIIIGCMLAVLTITIVLTRRAVPVYQGSSTLRIEEKEPNLPEVFRTSGGSRLATEIEELRSRALAAGVVTELGLRLSILEPRVTRRSHLLRDVKVSDSAATANYSLIRQSDGEFFLVKDSSAARQDTVATVRVGQLVQGAGFSFVLAPAAAQQPRIRFRIGSLNGVAARTAHKISASRASRDVNMVDVSYRSPDQEEAWRVPQVLVAHYIAQRQELQSLETRSTIDFLRKQIATISTQLAESERKLESYRERFEVINPEAEATNQVGRLVSMQTQRGLLDNERTALAALLADVDGQAASHKPGDPSPYRRLLAFPTLLQSQAATGLLQSLTTAEDQYKALLTRRTPEDSDVKALESRIQELEHELRAMAATYLQGLTNQVKSYDDGLQNFRGQLRAIPEKELQYARLERQPKVLEGVYTMLQTRLKEAEVAVAARDPSVRVVDAAIPPTRPVWPKPLLNAIAALVCGLLLGVAVAFAREYMDRRIRTRMDVRGTTGLPVIGLIPRIYRRGSPVALIAEPKRRKTGSTPAPAPRPQLTPSTTYSFLGADQADARTEPVGASVSQLPPPPRREALTISAKAAVIAEALGVLQTNIAFSPKDAPAKTLVFTSPLSGDGKTTTVVNLSLSLAQRGIRVLLIDADVRRGVVHSIFRGPREPGLSEVLRGLHSFESARRGVTVGEHGVMDYLTSGKLYPGEYGLVASESMQALLAQVREEYDLVIVDTPPVNIITDAAILAANADGVILVARVGVTESTALSYAVEQLRNVRAPLLGVVLNDIDLQRDAAYDSTYKYFQGYEYSSHS
jgi:capsular exopolysaccharide synthesis family protein